MAQQIYALLVGINDYFNQPLRGCVNDIDAVDNWLNTTYGSTGNLHTKRVTDKETDYLPTRANVIAAFDHFKQAKTDDICLFYYCGHGTNLGAPKVFESESGAGAVQALICMDWGRGEAGTGYLLDKELSFLIWKTTTENPGIHFIAITDCCHSGSATRDVEVDIAFSERQLNILEQSPAVENYLGFDYVSTTGEKAYEVVKDAATGAIVSVEVKTGSHLHIAASQDSEVAKELTVKENVRGAFTYVMIKLLEETAGNISYSQLTEFAAIRLKNLYFKNDKPFIVQHPKINMYQISNTYIDRVFLSAATIQQGNSYTVYFDNEFGWCIAAGSLHNVSAGDNAFIHLDSNTVVHFTLQKCSLLFSILSPTDNEALLADVALRKKRFAGYLKGVLGQAIKIGFGNTVANDIKTFILNAQVKTDHAAEGLLNFPGLALQNDNAAQENGYIIEQQLSAENEALIFVTNTAKEIVLQRVTATNIARLLQNMATISKWQAVLNLANPGSDIEDYAINLECATGVDVNGLIFQPGTIGQPNNLPYTSLNGSSFKPAFRLSITNNGSTAIFISVAYMGADYSISSAGDGGFDDMQIEPGNTQWLLTPNTKKKKIELVNTGTAPITEYIKLFISVSRPIPLYSLQQKRIDEDLTRALAKDEQVFEDWKTMLIPFVISPA
ncbi:caspase family protein [Limnovirga soli]|uniref:Peptidase C14 caspase domain-containing protein n=1 Tax=Limnovirga soli TaxID=2656915 RepID=A0A8J8FC99_9BACT|nr:caspase family protein [Limnovirga soli]NNV54867.1 hypothetical protein [Limnovirga soli]